MKAYQQFIDQFSNHLNGFSHALEKKEPKELYIPSAYIISLGGKRLRPLLALLACDLFDSPVNKALNSALAVELFHNFSLVHDDILDEAPIRRGQMTVHKKWNQNIAILSGDALLVKSFEILQNYPSEEMKQLSVLLSRTAMEVCEGQQLDMNFESRLQVSIPEYLNMIRLKTAVLLGCSLQMGAVNAGANSEQQEHIFTFGENLGIAFQLMDDYLDVFADQPEKFGKRIGGDILSNKKTFLLLKALEQSNEQESHQIHQLLTSKLISDDEKVNQMLNLYKKLKIQELCKTEADHFTHLALSALKKLEANEEKKKLLIHFSTELLNRQV